MLINMLVNMLLVLCSYDVGGGVICLTCPRNVCSVDSAICS